MKNWVFRLFFPAFENEDSKLAINWLTQLKVAADILVNGLILLLLMLLIIYVDPFATMFSDLPIEDHQRFVEELIFNNLSKWPLLFPLLALVFLINLLMANRIVSPIAALQKRFKKYLKTEKVRKSESEGRDYFHQVSSMVDELQTSLNRDMLFLKDEVARIESMVSEGSISDPEAVQKVKAALEKIQNHFDLENTTSKGEGDAE